MQKVLVTGANGMLGQDLCPILEDEGYEVYATDKNNMSITSKEAVSKAFEQIKPDIVIHCAAYTNVDKAEEETQTARQLNVIGTENIAKMCAKTNAALVYISTDYVFDGELDRPYTPDDNPNPQNQYGFTKWEGEMKVIQHCPNHYIVRTSWLYGIHGKNFVETMLSLFDKPLLTVVDDQIGCPTWTVDLANAIIQIIQTKSYGTYHACGGGYTSWYGFAKEIFKLAKKEVNLVPCKTEEFPRAAKRPKYTVMDNDGLCRPWQRALKDYMNLRDDEGV
jgi:dTDP-4-dehydrorhamnose reductase